jgi:hypothetical protein
MAVGVTLHEIVRMRRFTRVAAAYLRIILHEIIKYAAITMAAADCGEMGHGLGEFAEARRFSPIVQRASPGKGLGISAHQSGHM